MRRFAALFLILVLAACDKPALRTQSTNNVKVSVELLFRNEGCNVWRFYDSGYPIYYVTCGPEVQTSWNERHYTGKSYYGIPKQVVTRMPLKDDTE